jgi:hypothetical protein
MGLDKKFLGIIITVYKVFSGYGHLGLTTQIEIRPVVRSSRASPLYSHHEDDSTMPFRISEPIVAPSPAPNGFDAPGYLTNRAAGFGAPPDLSVGYHLDALVDQMLAKVDELASDIHKGLSIEDPLNKLAAMISFPLDNPAVAPRMYELMVAKSDELEASLTRLERAIEDKSLELDRRRAEAHLEVERLRKASEETRLGYERLLAEEARLRTALQRNEEEIRRLERLRAEEADSGLPGSRVTGRRRPGQGKKGKGRGRPKKR